ncbi:MAG: HAD-IA family hydrolase, partial [Phycisphaerales bacterium]
TRVGLSDLLRITLPGDARSFDRLRGAIETALRPQALLLDLDGVIADVGNSYRAAILETARSFGVALTPGDVAAAKRAGDANNDWALTLRLLESRGVSTDLPEVTRRFQRVYEGSNGAAALRENESLIPPRDGLRRLAERLPLAIVTGRPRSEAEWFLRRAGVEDLFQTLVCMEDAPAKPSAQPVLLALRRLGVERAWMLGDTPDDAIGARAAGVVPIGVAAPGEDPSESRDALLGAGCARVLDEFNDILEVLP